MRKTKNTLSIISIILVVLGAAALLLFPVFHGLFKPETASESLFPLYNLLVPKQLFNFQAIVDLVMASDFMGLLSYVNLFRLATWLVLLILVVFFIVWFVKIIIKKKPVELIWWFLLLIVIAAAVDVLNIAFLTGFKISETNPKTFTYKEGVADGISNSLVTYLFSLAMPSADGTFSQVINPTTCWIELAGFACAAIGLVLAIVSVALQIAWLKTVQVPVKEEATEEIPEEVEEPSITEEIQPEEVVEETIPEVAPVQAVSEPVVEEESGTNNYKVVRRILVHKSGKVIRVLNEHFYDVTTDIYIEPGFEEPFDPNETEKAHYEKIINMNQETPTVPNKPVAKPVAIEKETAENDNQEYERISFNERIKKADSSLKSIYNELKSEIMSYGVKSRVSAGGDMFRLHTKTYVKMTVAGKSIKLYLALNPKDYADSTIPFDDASKKNLYKDIPFVFKVKSPLSLRRAKQLIADTMLKDKLVQGKVEKRNWVKEL